MNFALLYKMQDYYLVATPAGHQQTPLAANKPNRLMYHKSQIKDINAIAPEIFAYVNQLTQASNQASNKTIFKTYMFDNNIILIGFSRFESIAAPWLQAKIKARALVEIAQYRLNVRQQLISSLSVEHSTLKDLLAGYAQYTQHDEYSLWIYNEETRYFTYIEGSAPPEKDYIPPDEQTSLAVVLDNDFRFESRAPIDCHRAPFKQMGMKSLTRMALKLGPHCQPAVLTFYSRYDQFKIQSSVIQDIRSLIEMKYHHQLQGAARGLEKITQALFAKQTAGIASYMHALTENICKALQYEAASVFFVLPDSGDLELISTWDNITQGEPNKPVICPANVQSLTQQVKDNPQAIHLIYDLAENELNPPIYTETTDTGPKNWTGVAMRFEGKVKAVLRIQNKYIIDNTGQKRIIAPRPSDSFDITTIKAIVESQLSNSLRMAELEKRLDLHDNLSKVYRHEIRGPVSSIVTIPRQLIQKLKRKPLQTEDIDSAIRGLKDLEALTGNLAMIAKTYDIERLICEDDGDGQTLSLLGELIIPIDKLTKHYYKTKYDSTLIIDHDSMRGASVYGKKELYNMVLYALLDNAGKYQEQESGTIKVYAKYQPTDEDVYLYVENNGLEIMDDETTTIFENDGRGKSAKEYRIDGSGIGLWLASTIMAKYNGHIELDNKYDPVIFKLTIPKGRK